MYIFVAGRAAMSQENNVLEKKEKEINDLVTKGVSDTIFVWAYEKQILPALRRFENLMMQRKKNVHGFWRSVDDGDR